jgi:hypothetical protein
MESLALLVALILLVVYGSGLIAFVLSWFPNKVARIASFVFSGISILSGLWLAIMLLQGNGLMVGGLPIALGAVSIWNAIRVSKKA